MSELIDPRTGELLDFIARRGDSPVAKRGPTSKRQRWGARQILQTSAGTIPGVSTATTLIDTGDLGRDFPIDIQIRWGIVDLNNPMSPPAVFTELNPVTNALARFKIRRGVDPASPVAVDSHVLDIGAALPDVVPFDIITARALGIDLEITGGAAAAIWVEAIATILTDIATADRRSGYRFTRPPLFVAAVPGTTTLLLLRNARVQFVVVNTSTNADLILHFGGAASWAGPVGSVVLPRNMFASYESPIGGYKGVLTGAWSDPVPNGGALVTDGSYF